MFMEFILQSNFDTIATNNRVMYVSMIVKEL